MKNLVLITLSGHTASFHAEQDAYDALRRYLDRAKRSLQHDPDHEEVLRDLEQSIGNKLAVRLQSAEQVLTLGDVNAVLAEVGPVAGEADTPPKGRRRLVRIQEGQDILGICQGLSAHSDIDVDWIRTIFIGLALVTGGAFILVYFAAAFFLPLSPLAKNTSPDMEAIQHCNVELANKKDLPLGRSFLLASSRPSTL